MQPQIIDYLTAALVLITAVYSYLTYKMAKSSEASVQAVREQSEALLRPYITISTFVRPHTPILYLKIENAGRTAAEDLQLSMDKDFFQFGEPSARNLRTMEAFSQPIKSLPPGGKLVFALAQGFIIFAKGADQSVVPSQFKVKALYRSGSKTIEEVNHIDLTPYIGSEGERDPIVDELEKMRAILEKRK